MDHFYKLSFENSLLLSTFLFNILVKSHDNLISENDAMTVTKEYDMTVVK